MSNDLVLAEKKKEITIVTINRPRVRNCVNKPTAEALTKAFEEFEKDCTAKVAILTGADGCFCAGADLQAVASADSTLTNTIHKTGQGPMGPSRLLLTKPVIAAVAGYAVAGGLELALWCDLRVAEEDAIFGVFCRRWGVPLIDGGTVRLPRLIGLSNALDMILTGRPVTATEGKSMGLVNRVVPKGQSLIEAQKLAELIANYPQLCMRGDRLSAYHQFDATSLQQAIEFEFDQGMKALQSGETVTGATKFAKGSGRHGSFQDFTPKL